MTRNVDRLAPLALALALAACGAGGGGGGVNSVASVPGPATPPARTPLPPTPATTTGSYAGISNYTSFTYDAAGHPNEAVVPLQMAPEGSVNLAVNASTRTYTLTVTAGPYRFPTGQMTMPAESDLGYTRSFPLRSGTGPEFFTPAAQVARGDLVTQNAPAGTGANGAIRAIVSWVRLYNVGHMDGMPRYLSAAQWGQFYTENASGVPSPENFKPTEQTTGTMVFGPRTEPGDIPVSGRARYVLESLSGGFLPPSTDEYGEVYNPDGDTVLDIDFATRKLDAIYDLSNSSDLFKYDEFGDIVTDSDGNGIVEGTVRTSVHASGSTIIGNSGSFSIALAGTGSVHAEQTGLPPIANIFVPVSGDITGAFFGPKAAEVGGIWNLPVITGQDGSTTMITGDFAGIRETH